MKTRWMIALSIVTLAGLLHAQNTSVSTGRAVVGHGPKSAHRGMVIRREMGKWWQNPDIVSKLQLNDGQISQLNQVFYDHKMKLIDYGAEMEKQDLKLQNLLDADQPDEGQVSSQVDQVLAARGKLEREFTMMNLNLRKVLTLDQWRQLKAVRGDAGPGDNFIFFQKKIGPGGPGPGTGPDMMPLPPPPPGEFE
jgi:Spy/CpxP family protein refolding chaperone